MKKLVSLLLVLAMVLGMSPAVFAAPGEWNEPAVLVEGDNAAHAPGGAEGYYYTYTAPADGKLTLDITSATNLGRAGWEIVVDWEYYTEAVTLDVTGGVPMEIQVLTHDSNKYDNVASDFVLNAHFEPNEPIVTEEPEVTEAPEVTEPEVGTKENPADMVLGEMAFSLAEGNTDGYYMLYTVPADGTLSVTVETAAPIIQANLLNTTAGFVYDEIYASGETLTLEAAAGDLIRFCALVPGLPQPMSP